jgi:uncharacterized Fe-S cluster protein YjdI
MDTMRDRLQTYEGDGFAVTFDPAVCIHSGKCVRGLPAVFDVKRKRWIDVKAGSAEEIAAQIARCPSGALQFIRREVAAGAGEDETT